MHKDLKKNKSNKLHSIYPITITARFNRDHEELKLTCFTLLNKSNGNFGAKNADQGGEIHVNRKI